MLLAEVGSLLAPQGAVRAAGLHRNRVSKDGFVITITVPIDLHGAQGRSFHSPGTSGGFGAQGLASIWESGAEGVWNAGLEGYQFRGCYTFKIDVEIAIIPPGQAGSPDHHHVWLMWTSYRSHVYRGTGSERGVDNSLPFQGSAEGFWGTGNSVEIAHEVGHILGLGDDYTDVVNSEGEVVGSEPKPGREGTLLDSGSSVDQEIVDRIGENAAEQLELPPCINGTVNIVQEETRDNEVRTATVDFAVAVAPDESGQMTGTATGAFGLNGVYSSGGCEFSFGTSADVSLELTASGSDDGPYTIQSSAPQIIERTQRYYLCSDPVDFTMRWEVSLKVEDVVFEDGYYSDSGEGLDVVLFYIGHE
jgi:hypothetical protein